MRRLWMRIRIPFAIIAFLVFALALARIFSGPEDTWIKNEQGEWIKHGYPSGPPPAQDYQESPYQIVIPLVFLVAFATPLILIGKHKSQNRLNFEKATSDIKLYWYLSTSLFLFGTLTLVGLMIELFLSETSSGGNILVGQQSLLTCVFIASLAGFAGLCIVTSIQFFMLKRNVNDHYQIERSFREILEILENHPQR